MGDYFSKGKMGGQINSKIRNQDSLAAVYAIQQLNNPDIFGFGVDINNFSIRCEGDDDVSIADKHTKIFIQVKSTAISNKDFYKVMDNFMENNNDYQECFYVLAIFENFKVNNKNIIDRLKPYRSLYLDTNEREEKKISVKKEFMKDFKLEKYERIIDRFVIDERPLFRSNKDTRAIFSMYLRLVYGFKNQNEEYIDPIFEKLVMKMGELRADRGHIDREKIEELIGMELVRGSAFNKTSLISGYQKTESGYVKDSQRQIKFTNIQKGRRIAFKSIVKEWRKFYFKESIKSFFIGHYICPECRHPLMANLCGLTSRGIACPDCGYSPYLTMFLFCVCGSYELVKSQPELKDEKIFNYLNNFYNKGNSKCSDCKKELFDDSVELRIMLLPIPYPFGKFKDIKKIYQNNK